MSEAINFENMVKEFPGFKLGPLDFTIEQGRFVGYVGPNGAGKTTTMHCITGLLKHDSGVIKILGAENNPNETDWKYNIGYVGDRHVFYENWNATKNLNFIAQFYPDWDCKKADSLVERFNLQINKAVSNLSKGNRMKLALIQVLARCPKVLIFDEPTEGLDPIVRSEFMDVLFEVIQDEEKSVFYSTHLISEIERVCDELIFINHGIITQKSDKEKLFDDWRVITFKTGESIEKLKGVVNLISDNGVYKIITGDFTKTLEEIKALNVTDIKDTRMSLEEIAVNVLKGVGNVEIS